MFENLTLEECVYLVLMTTAACAVLVALLHCIWCICVCHRKRRRGKRLPVILTAESRTPEEVGSHIELQNISPREAEEASALPHDQPAESQDSLRTPKQKPPNSGKTDTSEKGFEYKGIKFPPIIRFETKSSGNHEQLQSSFSKEGVSENNIDEPPQAINLKDHSVNEEICSATNSLSDDVFGSVQSDDDKHNYDVIPMLPPGRRSVYCTRQRVREGLDPEGNNAYDGTGLLRAETFDEKEKRKTEQTLETADNLYESFSTGYVTQSNIKSQSNFHTSKQTSSNPHIEDGELFPDSDSVYAVPKSSYYPGYMNYRESLALMGNLTKNAQADIGELSVEPETSISGLFVDPMSSSPTSNNRLHVKLGRSGQAIGKGFNVDPENSGQTSPAKPIVDPLSCNLTHSEHRVELVRRGQSFEIDPRSSRQSNASTPKVDPDSSRQTNTSGVKVNPETSGQANTSRLKVHSNSSRRANTSGQRVGRGSRSQTSISGISVVPGRCEQTNIEEVKVNPRSVSQIRACGHLAAPGSREEIKSSESVIIDISGLAAVSGSNNETSTIPDNSDGYVMKDSVNPSTPSVCQGAVATDKTGYIIMSGSAQSNAGRMEVEANQSFEPPTLSEIQQEILSRYARPEYQLQTEGKTHNYEGMYDDQYDIGYGGGYVNWKGAQAPKRVQQAGKINDIANLDGAPSSRKS